MYKFALALCSYIIFRFAARPQRAVAWSSGVVGFDDGSAPVVLGNCGARPKPKRGPEGWDVAAGGVLLHRKQHPTLTPEQGWANLPTLGGQRPDSERPAPTSRVVTQRAGTTSAIGRGLSSSALSSQPHQQAVR